MPLGQCRLCLQTVDLRSSHFLPASLYKGARTPGLKNPNPVLATKKVSLTSSKQLQTYLLCGDCEDRFNRNGEHEVLRWLAPNPNAKGIFPLLDRLSAATPRYSTLGLVGYWASDVGIDADKFAYFALSLLWRAAVHQWQLPDGTITSHIDLNDFEEPIRKYLLGDSPFPAHVIVMVTACTDLVSRNATFTPIAFPDDPHTTYVILTQGVQFRVGVNLPPPMRQLCCTSSPQKWIFSRSCEDETMQSWASLLTTSTPVPNLARFLNARQRKASGE